MLTQINILIQDMVLDSNLVWNFYELTVALEKKAIIFGVDISSLGQTDDMKKDILILGKGPTEALDDTTMTAEAQYSINFSRLQRKFSLSLHYNGGNSFLSVNAT